MKIELTIFEKIKFDSIVRFFLLLVKEHRTGAGKIMLLIDGSKIKFFIEKKGKKTLIALLNFSNYFYNDKQFFFSLYFR